MIKYKCNKKYLLCLCGTDLVFFLYILFITADSFSTGIKYLALISAISLTYYIAIAATTVYCISNSSLIYKTIFKKVEIKWNDVFIIERRSHSFAEKLSVAVYSRDYRKVIPITSWVKNYECLLYAVVEKSKNNEGVLIDKDLAKLFQKLERRPNQ